MGARCHRSGYFESMPRATRGLILGGPGTGGWVPVGRFLGMHHRREGEMARFSLMPKSHEKSRLGSENRSRGPNGGKKNSSESRNSQLHFGGFYGLVDFLVAEN